ncbi:MAG: hypothetical protein IAE63_01480 [Alphaproteobacteria bacterium]|jgi:hypothetical protein|nr:hypothetical protein [Alphaproteobacteria bacterium]
MIEVAVGDPVFDQVGVNGTFVSSDSNADNSGNPLAHACRAEAARWGGDLRIENCDGLALGSSFGRAATQIAGMPRVGVAVGYNPKVAM